MNIGSPPPTWVRGSGQKTGKSSSRRTRYRRVLIPSLVQGLHCPKGTRAFREGKLLVLQLRIETTEGRLPWHGAKMNPLMLLVLKDAPALMITRRGTSQKQSEQSQSRSDGRSPGPETAAPVCRRKRPTGTARTSGGLSCKITLGSSPEPQ